MITIEDVTLSLGDVIWLVAMTSPFWIALASMLVMLVTRTGPADIVPDYENKWRYPGY